MGQYSPENARGMSALFGVVALVGVVLVVASILWLTLPTDEPPQAHTGEVEVLETQNGVAVEVSDAGNAEQFRVRVNGEPVGHPLEPTADDRQLEYGDEVEPGDTVEVISVLETGDEKLVRSYSARGPIDYDAELTVHVTDSTDGSDISAATVTAVAASAQCDPTRRACSWTNSTQSDGTTQFSVTDTYTYTVTADAADYEEQSTDVKVLSTTGIEVALEPESTTGPKACAAHYNTNSGSGTQSDPYQINSLNGLQCIGYDDYRTDHHELVGDIDASATAPGETWDAPNDMRIDASKGFQPIGSDSDPFTGSLTGTGSYEITGLHIDRPAEDHIGIFGVMGQSGAVHDLTVRDATIAGNEQTGTVVGDTAGSVKDVTVIDTQIEAQGDHVGGIIGIIDDDAHSVESNPSVDDFTDLTVRGDNTHIVGAHEVGGIAGDLGIDTRITNTTFEDGEVLSVYGAGGISGGYGPHPSSTAASDSQLENATVRNATIRGIVGDGSSGYTYSDAQIRDAYEDRRGMLVGGIMGSNKGHTVIDGATVRETTVEGARWVGGISGWMGSGYVSDPSESVHASDLNVHSVTVIGYGETESGVTGRGAGGITSWLANGRIEDASGTDITIRAEGGRYHGGIMGFLSADAEFVGSGTFTGRVYKAGGGPNVEACIGWEDGYASYDCDITGP